MSKGSLYRVSPDKIPKVLGMEQSMAHMDAYINLKKKSAFLVLEGGGRHFFENIYKCHIFSVDDGPNSYRTLFFR